MHFKRGIKLNRASCNGKLDGFFETIGFTFLDFLVCLAVILTTAFETGTSNRLWSCFFLWFSGGFSFASLALSFCFYFFLMLFRFFTSFGEFFFDNFFSWSFDCFWGGLKNFFGFFCHKISFRGTNERSALPTLNLTCYILS